MTSNFIEIDGRQFRDLDHDGVLAPYEDHRLSAEERTKDLVSRMTLAEKAGVMMHGTLQTYGELGVLGVGSSYDLDAARVLIKSSHINHAITRAADGDVKSLARQHNALQEIAASTRLGIPLTISSDARHHFQTVTGASSRARSMSQWPESTGLAAIGSDPLTENFADIVRQEYRALGIHMSLAPQADIATDPRWPRIAGTFGEDPGLARRMVAAYVRGVQGESLETGVASVVKHWVGYPAAPEGFDGHNHYGRFSALTEQSLQLHIEPFLGAFREGVTGVMPTYTILKDLALNGVQIEQVAGGYSRELIDELLRTTHSFDGFVLSDWAIYRDLTPATINPKAPQTPADIAMCWGVENLSRQERFAKSVNAGTDQLGGEEDAKTLVNAVESGLIEGARVDEAVSRLLVVKFRQGLFDNPFVDVDAAAEIVGCKSFCDAGRQAQKKSLICLKKPSAVLTGNHVLKGFDTSSSEEGDYAVVRLSTPHQRLHPNFLFGMRQQEGDLDFKPESEEVELLKTLSAQMPVIGVITMPRPAVLTTIMEYLDGVYVDLGISDDVLLDTLTSDDVDEVQDASEATLPFELPSSMQAVQDQRPDLPADSAEPLFKIHTNHTINPEA